MAASERVTTLRGGHDGSQSRSGATGSTTGISACLQMYCTMGVVPPPPWSNGGVIDARCKIDWACACRSFAAEGGTDESGEHLCSSVSEPNSQLAATPPATSNSTTDKKPLPPQRRGKTTWDKTTGKWSWVATALRDRGVKPRPTTDAIDDLRHEISARLSSLTALALSFEVKRRQDRISDLIVTKA